jgi:hypothetical protein
MKIEEALEIIQDVATDLGEPVLETLIYMQDNLEDFSDNEVRAFRVTMRDFQKLFAIKA